MNRSGILLLLFAAFSMLGAHAHSADQRMNVLFIVADDLRPELGCYDKPHIHSPRIDELAARGMVFKRAYCQAAVCRASRVSLLTGLRPDSTEIWTNGSKHKHFRDHLSDIATLPQQFMDHGYQSLAFGKIYHGAFAVRNRWNDNDSWSVPGWLPDPRYYYTDEGVRIAREVFARKTKAKGPQIDNWTKSFVLGLSHEAPDVDDDVLQDGQIAARGIEALRTIKDKPFFLALGFLKPHLPFIAPKKYWDLYPPDKVKVASNLFAPQDAPRFASTAWGHPRTYTDFPNKGEPSDELVRELTRGYAACVSFVDAQVGRVLDELDRLGLRDNTIVVLWGDHGWHLGENHIWGKATNFELSTRAPLIMFDPRVKSAGGKTNALVEFVDVYPTLCELAGLPLPKHLEGTSFAPLLSHPDRAWKNAAFSQYPSGSHLGHSMRTDRYRFTRWTRNQKLGGLELYDHLSDPQENINIANDPENAKLVTQLTAQLNAGWRASLPPKPTRTLTQTRTPALKPVHTPARRSDELADTVRQCKKYLQSDDAGERKLLAGKLASHDDRWRSVLAALRPPTKLDGKPGYYREEHFSDAELRKKHPDDLIYYIVPKSYRPERATGLVIFMHGGGKGSPRNSPARYMQPEDPSEAYIGDIFEQTGLIGVAPSAPWNPNNHSRWTLPETDDYIADVITESATRFHIDPDRVILWGHSMGGFGGFQQVQRQPDRFAAVIASAGSWSLANWPVIRGTTFCIVHGTRDAEPGVRDRHTDIQFARQAHQLLSGLQIHHVYKEHPGPHPVVHAKKPVLEFLQNHSELKRERFPPQVAVASPVGFRANAAYKKSHSHWLSLDEAFEDSELEYDTLDIPGRGYKNDSPVDDWNGWMLTHQREKRPGAMVEAVNLGNNRFDIRTTGVAQFTLWLHPNMVNFNEPIHVTINGEPRTQQRLKPSLAILLDSFARRKDWNLTYPARWTIRVPAAEKSD